MVVYNEPLERLLPPEAAMMVSDQGLHGASGLRCVERSFRTELLCSSPHSCP